MERNGTVFSHSVFKLSMKTEQKYIQKLLKVENDSRLCGENVKFAKLYR